MEVIRVHDPKTLWVDLWVSFKHLERFSRQERRLYEAYLRKELASVGFKLRYREQVSSPKNPEWSASQLIRGEVASRGVSGIPSPGFFRILSRRLTHHEVATLALRGNAAS